ncbi:hypothetical protein SAMN05216184_10492 [Georgenia satyanarayanai]|uniref:Peptidase S74 domain-containing protein n=1 Tax=Georgenia satyanarayanai TaxID=860221 RepID=A0A2Y9ADJ1_9MICO|nr:tail fiber domain-containing protein [Georgenia satyanarayanai]PYG00153.1 hypothetical protein A8987_10492 [Georgenia satyanarayanai]SSA40367.1 hypothetical protein SAMN05216184_10492 [Georgenia satyanarayanai]
MGAIENVAGLLLQQGRRLSVLENTPRLPYSSIPATPGSSLDVVDPETGSPVVVIGDQHDGTWGAYPIDGPIPPVPSAPVVQDGVGRLVISYDGRMASDEDRFPMDGEGVEAWVRPLPASDVGEPAEVETEPVPDPEDDPDDPTPPEPVPDLDDVDDPFPNLEGARLVATFPASGGTTTATLTLGSWMVVLVTKSIPGRRSAPSGIATGTVLSVLDSAVVAELDERLQDNETQLADARDRLASAEQLVNVTFPTTLAWLTDDVQAIQQQVSSIVTGSGQRIKVGTTAPAPADADIWIDTTGEAPVPKYHDGTEWVPLSDPAAIQAALDAAKAHADNLPKVLHGTTAPSQQLQAPNGSVYFQHIGTVSGQVVGQWTRSNSTWVATPIRSEAIANVDIGKLTAGAADIIEVVARKIAAAAGQFVELDVGQLRVTGTTNLNEAVAKKIFTNIFAANKVTAVHADLGSFAADEGFVGSLRTATLVVGGPWQASEVGSLPASKIGSGTLADARIPVLQQSKVNGLPGRLGLYDEIRERVTAWTATGTTRIDGGRIETDSIKALQIDLVDLRSVFVTADLFQGRTFIGGTFTGGTFRTAATGQRTQLDTVGLRAWNAGLQQTVNIDGVSNWLAGEFRTARPGSSGMLATQSNRGYPILVFSESGEGYWSDAYITAGFNWDGYPQWDLMLSARTGGYIRVDGGITGMPAGTLYSVGRWLIQPDGLGTFSALDINGRINADSIGLTANTDTRFYFENIGGGRVRAPGAANTTTTTDPNMFVAPSNGTLARSTSARRYKDVIEPVDTDVPARLLDVDPVTWFDHGDAERLADYISRSTAFGPEPNPAELDAIQPLRRIPGLIAEDVEAAGLTEFVTYGDDGQVEGLAYGRLWTLLIPLVRDLRDRVTSLEGRP